MGPQDVLPALVSAIINLLVVLIAIVAAIAIPIFAVLSGVALFGASVFIVFRVFMKFFWLIDIGFGIYGYVTNNWIPIVVAVVALPIWYSVFCFSCSGLKGDTHHFPRQWDEYGGWSEAYNTFEPCKVCQGTGYGWLRRRSQDQKSNRTKRR